jgi:hypothetical protein
LHGSQFSSRGGHRQDRKPVPSHPIRCCHGRESSCESAFPRTDIPRESDFRGSAYR